MLLNRISELALSCGYESIFIEAHEKKTLPALLIPPLRQLLFKLDRADNVSEKVKRSFRVLKGFLNNLKFKVPGVEITLDIDPEEGVADSGDLEADLPNLLEAIAECCCQTEIRWLRSSLMSFNIYRNLR